GRCDEAIAEIEVALKLDPLLLHLNAAAVMHHYLARRHHGAIEAGRKALELDPNFFPTWLWTGLAHQASGELAEAVTELRQARALSGGSTLAAAMLAGGLAASGKDDEATALLAELEAIGQSRYVPQTHVAAAHVARGAKSEALSCLEKACDEHCV